MPPKKKAAAAASGSVFDGETFCVSGSFSLSQGEMKELIIRNGGHIADTPNKSCTFVVSDSIGSSKTLKAVKDGIDVVTEAWVEQSIKAGVMSTDKKLFLSGGGAAPAAAADDDDEDDAPKTKAKKAPAAKKTAGTKRKAKAADDDDEEEDDDADDSNKAQKSTAASTPSAKSTQSSAAPVNVKTVVVKGAAPVDDLCPKAGTCRVYQDGSNVYDAMLNQTNIGNNNNKFYVVQLLETDASPKQYFVWTRWGRVGAPGQNALFPCGGNLDAAKGQFDTKFHDKTKNHWSNRANFVSYSGKYTLIERDYSADDDMPDAADTSAAASSVKIPDSKLDSRVQDLIKLICDLKMMKDAMLEVGYDADKLPLGKLSKDHIKKGYEVLQELSTILNSSSPNRNQILDCSNRFYTLIPHKTSGMRPPQPINSVQTLKEKISLVESLADVAIATNLLRQASTGAESLQNPVDHHYAKLKCDFSPVDRTADEFSMVQTYVKNTHGHTHTQYKLEVLDVFKLDREGETERFNAGGFDKTANTQLLWHGSRLTNFVGIISQGLRIAPPEAPVTGYMFGKGVYFADMVSKSGNYCNTTRSSGTACMLLCEVALGDMNELKQADYHASNLPTGKLSTKGLGANYPDPAHQRVLDNGVIVPLGPEKQDKIPGSSLLYNEYIVYSTAQIKMKYLVKLKFKY